MRPVRPSSCSVAVVPAGGVDTGPEASSTRKTNSPSSPAHSPQAVDLPETEPGDVLPVGASNAAS
jgi:hypothetical protein